MSKYSEEFTEKLIETVADLERQIDSICLIARLDAENAGREIQELKEIIDDLHANHSRRFDVV